MTPHRDEFHSSLYSSPATTPRSRARAWIVVGCFGALGCFAGLRWEATASADQQVVVHPGDDLQAMVVKNRPGTAFEITPGVYRLQSVQPKEGDSFIGQPGAILSGAVQLTSFTRQGPYWVAKVSAKERAPYRGKCDSQHPTCTYPEDLFIDNTPLERVASISDVAPGKWYLDYGTGKVYVGSDPSSHIVTMSVMPAAFWGNASHVTIKGLTIRKYASIAGFGAINAVDSLTTPGRPGQNWTVDSNDIYLNHGAGIRVNTGMVVSNNEIHDNGQIGVVGSGDTILVEKNEIYENNYAGYKKGWEAGGVKIAYFCKHVVVKNNFVHDNQGIGLWADISDSDFLFEGNHTARNQFAGIQYEISYGGVIRDNDVEDDGFSPPSRGTSLYYGAGIMVMNSEDVQVYGNRVSDCMNGAAGVQETRGKDPKTGAAYELRDLYVHDNTITQESGIAEGIMSSPLFGDKPFKSWNNRFANNTFHLADGNGKYFAWMGGTLSLRQWRQAR